MSKLLELTQKLIRSYVAKTMKQMKSDALSGDFADTGGKNVPKRFRKRQWGMKWAADKLVKMKKEETVNELSHEKLGQYGDAAFTQVDWLKKQTQTPGRKRIIKNREAGMNKVRDKLSKEETMNKNEEEFRLNLIRKILDEATRAKGKAGAKGQDTIGDEHPINIARKAIQLGRAMSLQHHNKEKSSVTPQHAHHILGHYGRLNKPHEKEGMINQIWGSSKGYRDYMQGKMHITPPKSISLGGSALVGGVRPINKATKKHK